MLRVVLGVIAGFVAWLTTWLGTERLLSAVWPDWFGTQQKAFESALTGAGPFAPETGFLVTHVISAAIISLAAGFLAALIAGEHQRAPLILGILLVTLGLAKAALSWSLVPLWYHLAFTVVLFPMPQVGGKLWSQLLSGPTNVAG